MRTPIATPAARHRWQRYPAVERRPVPWKNGGGVTYEIARDPPGAPLDAFDWRISIARVDAPGPFSPFPGVQRTFAVVAGALELYVGAAPPCALDAATPPIVFAGETPVYARPFGPTLDLNVMTRRAHCAARVEILAACDATLLASASTLAAIVVGLRPGARVAHGPETIELALHDACRIDGGGAAGARLTADADGAAALIRIDRCAG